MVNGCEVVVKGFKGEFIFMVVSFIEVVVEENQVLVFCFDDECELWLFYGLICMFINNNIIGVIQGYIKGFEVVGIGYCVQQKGSLVEFVFGFLYLVLIDLFVGIMFMVEGIIKFIVSGIDKQVVGEVVVNICKICKFELYKGKGVCYVGENVCCKVGKSGK